MNAADKMDASIDGTMVALAKARKGWVVHWTHPARAAHPFRLDCVDDIGDVINRNAVDCPDHGGQL